MNCVIFANGDFSPSTLPDTPWQQADLLIATDGGARHCHILQLIPHILLGDMDSITPELLAWFTKHGSEVLRFPPHKDKTDLELALETATARGAGNILILGALGGRWDMSIASIMLLAAPIPAGIALTLREGPDSLHCLHGGEHLQIHGRIGDILSLIPLAGPSRGISLNGLEYPLNDQDIPSGSTRGISNLFVHDTAEISLREGLLLIVHSRKNS